MLADRDYDVVVVEPNDSMRRNGIVRTQKRKMSLGLKNQKNRQVTGSFDFVTLGAHLMFVIVKKL